MDLLSNFPNDKRVRAVPNLRVQAGAWAPLAEAMGFGAEAPVELRPRDIRYDLKGQPIGFSVPYAEMAWRIKEVPDGDRNFADQLEAVGDRAQTFDLSGQRMLGVRNPGCRAGGEVAASAICAGGTAIRACVDPRPCGIVFSQQNRAEGVRHIFDSPHGVVERVLPLSIPLRPPGGGGYRNSKG
jgi:hypothetical protein